MVPNGIGRGANSRWETAVDESRTEMADRVARYQADWWPPAHQGRDGRQGSKGTRPTGEHLLRLPSPQTAAAAFNVVSSALVLL